MKQFLFPFLVLFVFLVLPGCSSSAIEVTSTPEPVNIEQPAPTAVAEPEQVESAAPESNTPAANFTDFADAYDLALPSQPFNYANPDLPAHFLTEDVTSLDNTPPDNPVTNEGATLGRVLFYDVNLSSNNTTSCASCHKQAYSFADPLRYSAGFTGHQTGRHSPGISNARYYPNGNFFWDERADTLEQQALMPIIDFVEMGLTLSQLEEKVQQTAYYPALFEAAFGSDEITGEQISFALAQFMRSMVSYQSKYDEGVATNFENFSSQEKLGMELFNGKARCSTCHETHLQVTTKAHNTGLDLLTTDAGVGGVTDDLSEDGAFKAPSLRNIALTAPYMHDGRFNSLREVVDFYNGKVQNHPNLAVELADADNHFLPKKLELETAERTALVSFLRTLTDDFFVTDEKFSDPFVAIRNDATVQSDATAGDGTALELAETSGTTYIVNTDRSTISWSGSKQVGVTHIGTVGISSGKLVIDNDQLLSGNFVIDMLSIEESEDEARLVKHLQTDDFFNVASFPEAKVEIIEVTPLEEAHTYDVRANLTIKSTTNEISFPATVVYDDENLSGVATIEFDRTLWDIRFGSGAFFSGLGDAIIEDIVGIRVALSANPIEDAASAPEQSGN